MPRTSWVLAAVAAAIAGAGCGDDGGTAIDAALADRPIDSLTDPPIDAPPIDGPVDAPTDAAGCGTDLRFVGEYLDWDSTNANFIGVGGATFTVVGDTNRTATTSPNGSLLMCLNPAAPSQLTIGAGGYINALMLVDPAVFAPAGSRFAARALQSAMGTAQFAEFGVTYNAAFANILVYKIGAPIPLTLSPAINPPQQTFVSDGANDITWSAGDTGTFTLFPNRPFSAAPLTLSSTSAFTGPTSIPIASGRFTIVVIR